MLASKKYNENQINLSLSKFKKIRTAKSQDLKEEIIEPTKQRPVFFIKATYSNMN